MEIRSTNHARERLSLFECRLVRVMKRICSDNVFDFLERLRNCSGLTNVSIEMLSTVVIKR
ncbi:MAG: hypothetical protein XD94_1313 [Mesotoga prima]|uniref:Uncharacterized protein n=1 Tax=Mesotoga prima TaxID=1184387 RepID=A0A101HMR1_9BACT|nr:MAG: hypothetical protein XD94_1313 [Mesotoga prima]